MDRLRTVLCVLAVLCTACGDGREHAAPDMVRQAGDAPLATALDAMSGWRQRSPDGAPSVAAEDAAAAGRYIATIAGCNACHTAGWLQSGDVPESQWMAGNPVGFEGAWGVRFAANLRLLARAWGEGRWAAELRGEAHAAMPWIGPDALSEKDARAVYRYVRDLGPVGEPMPAAIPPGDPITQPHRTLRVRSPAAPFRARSEPEGEGAAGAESAADSAADPAADSAADPAADPESAADLEAAADTEGATDDDARGAEASR